MKTILSAIVALTVLAGITAQSVSAFDAKEFFQQQERQSY